jgi:hypothetical protein
MTTNQKSYSFFFGRFVITARAFNRLNLIDVYVATLRHASGRAVPLCPLDLSGKSSSFKALCRQTTTHRDRHGTEFWIQTEGNLSKTTLRLADEC